MKIVIIGAGFTGTQLAKRLINGKNDVVLIDNDEETIRHASNRLDCTVLHADGNNLATLESVGIDKADALVCVTSSDEVNMITCSLVDAVYPNLLKIARVRNYAYYVNTADAEQKHSETFSSNHRPLYGIDFMIHPDVEAAQAIVNAVEHGAITDAVPFGESGFELTRVTIEKGSALEGQMLQNVRKLIDKPLLIAYVESGGITSLPSGGTILKAEDSLGLLMKKSDLQEFLKLCGSKMHEMKKIALLGAGRIGTIIAEKLIHRKKSFFSKVFGWQSKLTNEFAIIDSDEALTKAAAEQFKGAKVFRADISDEAFVKEEGLQNYDLIICATQNYELNMVLAAYMESLGIKNSICLVSTSAFADIARKIGVEVAVPIRDAVVDSIMSHLRGQSVTGIHTVNDGALEIVEIVIPKNSSVVGKPLKEIAENGKFLILVVQKSGTSQYVIPTGNTTIETGDKIVIITTSIDNQHVLDKFGGKK